MFNRKICTSIKALQHEAHLEAAWALRCVYEPMVKFQGDEIIELRHEVKRLKVYEEFVLGRGKRYGALSRARLRK